MHYAVVSSRSDGSLCAMLFLFPRRVVLGSYCMNGGPIAVQKNLAYEKNAWARRTESCKRLATNGYIDSVFMTTHCALDLMFISARKLMKGWQAGYESKSGICLA